MNNDLISREALRDEYFKKCNRECCTCVERDDESGDCGLIRYAPAVDAEPVRHGMWVEYDVREYADGICIPDYKCSECGRYECIKLPYCPNCGAKMDVERDE